MESSAEVKGCAPESTPTIARRSWHMMLLRMTTQPFQSGPRCRTLRAQRVPTEDRQVENQSRNPVRQSARLVPAPQITKITINRSPKKRAKVSFSSVFTAMPSAKTTRKLPALFTRNPPLAQLQRPLPKPSRITKSKDRKDAAHRYPANLERESEGCACGAADNKKTTNPNVNQQRLSIQAIVVLEPPSDLLKPVLQLPNQPCFFFSASLSRLVPVHARNRNHPNALESRLLAPCYKGRLRSVVWKINPHLVFWARPGMLPVFDLSLMGREFGYRLGTFLSMDAWKETGR